MTRKYLGWLFLLLIVFLSSSAFAGAFSGIGGDADLFPKNKPIVSVQMIPLLNFEGNSSQLIYGAGVNIGWPDLSFKFSYGKQGQVNYGGLGLRKKIYGGENEPFSLAIVWDVDSLSVPDISSIGTSYLGAVASKKIDNYYPYLGLFYSEYLNTNWLRSVVTFKYMYGVGVVGGIRYDFSNYWSGTTEFHYNSFNTRADLPYPKSIISMIMELSYKL